MDVGLMIFEPDSPVDAVGDTQHVFSSEDCSLCGGVN